METREFMKAARKIEALRSERLEEKGAFEMVAGHNYVAYLRHEDDGHISAEVFSWGVNHGKVYAGTVEEAKSKLHQMYDA